MSSMTTAIPRVRMNPGCQLVEDPFDGLAREINDAHREVQRHVKGMLLEAKRAGDALTEVKRGLLHGEFEAWVETKTCVPVRTARRYMQVAKSVVYDRFDPDATIDSVLDTNASKRRPKGNSNTPEFDINDAQHVKKLHALAQGGVGGEAVNARTKLDSFAQQFGMTGDEAVAKAYEVAPEVSYQEEHVRKYMDRKFGKKTKQELIEILMFCIGKHPDLIQDFK